ncbi:MAG: SagB/ThcOx family dehydrogenase [Bryobacteraceae bacterium]
MRKPLANCVRHALILAWICPVILPAQEAQLIALPKPQTTGGMPLMQALNERKSTREFGAEKLPQQVLANLLWAAFGVNRPDGRRTAPSASNRQEIEIYAVMADGVFLYDAQAHALRQVAKEDLRAATGGQDWVARAPLNLVYVADYAKMGNQSEDNKRANSNVDTGYISQNVYLYCASEGLGTVARGGVNRDEIQKALKLRPEQRVVLAQTVGYPLKK